MPNTDQYWQADTFLPDFELFGGMADSRDPVSGQSGVTLSANGVIRSYVNVTANCYINFGAALKRTGIFATPALQQEQFGTAASLPGPTGVANTSDPEGIRGMPPFLSSKLPTLVGTGGTSSGAI